MLPDIDNKHLTLLTDQSPRTTPDGSLWPTPGRRPGRLPTPHAGGWSTTGRSPWSATRPRGGSLRSAHLLVDTLLATACLLGSFLLLAHGGFGTSSSGSELTVASGILAAWSTLPLLIWRRAPFAVFVLIAVASTLSAGLGYTLGIPIGPAAALYLLADSRNEARPWSPRTAGAVIASLIAFLIATGAAAEGSFPAVDVVHNGLLWAVAWFAGERTRLRREHIAALEERVAHAEHEAEQERLLAVAQERARIARDLHDSAGHAINVIAVRAGAARLRHPHDPDRCLITLTGIEDLARQTVEEIDQFVGTLRDSGSSTIGAVDAPPGLASADTLIAQHAAAGLAVTNVTIGTVRTLGAAVDQAAYRILQEALTNAARHGAGPVRTQLVFGDTSLDLAVTNQVVGRNDARSSGGHGVIGMQERAQLLGGTLITECVDGEFRVAARLPYAGHRP